MNQCKISPVALGLSFGVLSAVVVIVATLLTLFLNGKPATLTVNSVALQYEFTILGSFIGGFFAFLHGLIWGTLIGWLYNCFLGCCSQACATPKPKTKKIAKE